MSNDLEYHGPTVNDTSLKLLFVDNKEDFTLMVPPVHGLELLIANNATEVSLDRLNGSASSLGIVLHLVLGNLTHGKVL